MSVFDKPRLTLRRSPARRATLRRAALRRAVAVAACGVAALSTLASPVQGSPTPAQFANLDGAPDAALAAHEPAVALVTRQTSPVKRHTSNVIDRSSNVPSVNAQSSIVNRQSPIQNQKSKIKNTAQCAGLNATTPISWFATDDVGNVDPDTPVDNYATGTVVIAPGFQYDCAPKDTSLVVMVYNQAFGTDPALVEKRTLQASPDAGVFYYVLTTPDGSPLQEGEWRTEFYQGQDVLSSGSVLVGNSPDVDVTTQALVQGTVTDQRTGKPIDQARVFVLNPGVSLADFLKETRREDVYVQTRTDSDGQFSLWKPLERNTQYAMLIAADGYKLRGTDRLIIGDAAASPVALTIQLVKR